MDYSLAAVKMYVTHLKPAKPAKELTSNGGAAFAIGSLIFQRVWLQVKFSPLLETMLYVIVQLRAPYSEHIVHCERSILFSEIYIQGQATHLSVSGDSTLYWQKIAKMFLLGLGSPGFQQGIFLEDR